MTIFKLERGRPLCRAHTDTLFYIHTRTTSWPPRTSACWMYGNSEARTCYPEHPLSALRKGQILRVMVGCSRWRHYWGKPGLMAGRWRTRVWIGGWGMDRELLGIVLLFSIDFEVRISLFFLILRSQLLTSSFGVTSSSPSAAYPTQCLYVDERDLYGGTAASYSAFLPPTGCISFERHCSRRTAVKLQLLNQLEEFFSIFSTV